MSILNKLKFHETETIEFVLIQPVIKVNIVEMEDCLVFEVIATRSNSVCKENVFIEGGSVGTTKFTADEFLQLLTEIKKLNIPYKIL